MRDLNLVVIFGGTGFIGTHLTQHLLLGNPTVEIVLVDIKEPRNDAYCSGLQEGLATGRVKYICWDVRQPIPPGLLPPRADLVVNLAAVHREPGHLPFEYYETNLLGAENACGYASAASAENMVFTSSISPYGPSEEPKTEKSLPVPETPYGGSKLAAEKIHMAWQAALNTRKLLIMRPGVVYGPGERGNVTRLIRSLIRGYFAYMGNRQTRKAGGYVKDLCRAIQFGLEYQDSTGEGVTILNFSVDPPPMLEQIVDAIRRIAGVRRSPISLSRKLLLALSFPIDSAARVFGINQPINPTRIRKLHRSTPIYPIRLKELGYVWKYSLEDAFRDWKKDNPSDFEK